MKNLTEVTIKGIVQGVGFRPFIYNLARSHNLKGYVLNDTTGVYIEVEGDRKDIEKFLENVKTKPPPMSEIFEMKTRDLEPKGYTDFVIRKSKKQQEKFMPISPELATCDECVGEIFDPSDRRYRYPFTNCTNCGPRFTIVKDIPYDRKFTTMSVFPMCEKCNAEYENPADRRFHAQPNACPVCGPRLFLLDEKGEKIAVDDVITEACRLFGEGRIIAVKGLGGYHLACDARNEEAVSALRARKYREYKPFAVMVRDVEGARRICYVNEEEEKILTGTRRPIVLLRKRPDCPLAEDVAPLQGYHGLMLPYTPLHHLLIAESGMDLVMTSGNISSEPIVYRDRESLERLSGIADYYIVHNREIHIRTDDSVARVLRGRETILRRSRGYAPYPILLSYQFKEPVLACGAELKNTFCLTRGNFAFISHHIGDLENLETLTSFETGIEHFKRIFNIEPTFIAYDLHPEYLSTKHALAADGVRKIGVQHHHAHIVSCMSENAVEGEAIGVSFDGTGYGTDGTIWGGEFLLCDYGGFERAGHLEYVPLPGGEKAIKEPWRIAAACLKKIYRESMPDLDIDFVRDMDMKKWSMIEKMIDRNVNSPMTSSSGRLFDAVSALIGIRKEIYYEGQAAIEMEMRADCDEGGTYDFDMDGTGGGITVLSEQLIRDIVDDIKKGTAVEKIAARFHNTMAEVILSVCLKMSVGTGIRTVVLSGGVFQNNLLINRTLSLLESKGFEVHTHHRVPTNDGGIALGQAVIANEVIKRGVI